MIIDVHTHLGWDFTSERSFTKEVLVGKMAEYNIGIQLVQPGTTHDLSNAVSQHNAIAELCKEYPGRFFGIANPNPHLEEADYKREAARCLEDLKFVGIKLQPYTTAVNPDSRAGRMAFDCARTHGVPVMVHTGTGFPYSSPANLIPVAKDYPDVKIIMAHCGAILFSNEANAAFAACPNIYGDISWAPGYQIKKWIRTYGRRFMFASDLAENTGTEIAKVKTYGFTAEEQESILWKTALEVFSLTVGGGGHGG